MKLRFQKIMGFHCITDTDGWWNYLEYQDGKLKIWGPPQTYPYILARRIV